MNPIEWAHFTRQISGARDGQQKNGGPKASIPHLSLIYKNCVRAPDLDQDPSQMAEQ